MRQHHPQIFFVDPDQGLPWMPLDGLIQLWAAFGNDACDGPQTVAALQATSQAFAALAEERLALGYYNMTGTRRGHPFSPQDREQALTANGGRLVRPARWGQGSSIEALEQAAAHWLEVADLLEQAARHWHQEDEALQHDIRVLSVHARSQRLRVWTIAQHLLQEEVLDYRKQHGIVTGLPGDESENNAKTEGEQRP